MSNNTNQPVLNIPLLRKVLEHIEAHQDEWEQSSWRLLDVDNNRCGTAMCFAGHAAHIMGCDWSKNHPEYVVADEADREWAEQQAHINLDVFEGEGELMHACWRAQRLLGLTDEQRMELFAGGNDLDDLREMVDRFERGALA